jgi:hypothetical protein
MSRAQVLSGPPADPQLKFSTPMPPGVASRDKVETRLGTLNFVDGFPDKASAEKPYDNLDFQRAVQSFLLALPAVSQVANRDAFATLKSPTFGLWVNCASPAFESLTSHTAPRPSAATRSGSGGTSGSIAIGNLPLLHRTSWCRDTGANYLATFTRSAYRKHSRCSLPHRHRSRATSRRCPASLARPAAAR